MKKNPRAKKNLKKAEGKKDKIVSVIRRLNWGRARGVAELGDGPPPQQWPAGHKGEGVTETNRAKRVTFYFHIFPTSSSPRPVSLF